MELSFVPTESNGKKAQKLGVVALFLAQVLLFVLWAVGVLALEHFLKLLAFTISALVAVVILPRPRKRYPSLLVRHGGAILMAAVSLAEIGFPWVPLPICEHCIASWRVLASGLKGPPGYLYGPALEYLMNVLTLLTVTPLTIVCMMAWKHASSYATHAIRTMMAVWFSSILWASQNFAMYCHDKTVITFLTYLALTFDPVHWCATMILFLRRSEQVICKPNDRPRLMVVALIASTTENIVSISPVLKSEHTNLIEISLSVIGDLLLLLFAVVCAWPLMRTLHQQRRLLLDKSWRLSGLPKAEANWAAKMLSTEIWAVVLTLGTTIVMRIFMSIMLVYQVKRFTYSYFFMVILPYRIYHILHGISLAILSGLLSSQQAVPKPELPPRSEASSASRFGAEELVWRSKVRELANRGFKLDKLLDFVEELLKGEIMPSFDPERSTTNDVVRQAVIPLSRGTGHGEGQALASIWNEGRPVLATRMVTHNWSNRFLHLVGAVIADSLGAGTYERVIEQLETLDGIEGLREDLILLDRMDTTYWVCAFSVNQHASICAGFGSPPPEDSDQYDQWVAKACDSVTQKPFKACDCQTTKYFNNEPALTELNKFDDMMALLANEAEGFVHIVGVDKNFDVFMRAWCVAEMVEGGTLHVPQRVIIHSNNSLERHYMALAALDVRMCQATRAEDKEEILARIEDISIFNEYLQWLLFDAEGLFGELIDQEARLNAVGSILQRMKRSNARYLGGESNAEMDDSEMNADEVSDFSDDSSSRSTTETYDDDEVENPKSLV